MRIIASANQKGGCGKTTTAINLSSSLAQKGKKVLLIDFDPQAHATMGLNVTSSDLDLSIYDVISPKRNTTVALDDILVPIKENFDLAPSNVVLSVVEQELTNLEGREDRLMTAINGMQATYDYIIIDCPPSIGHLCFNALRAAEEVIIPIDMSLFSLRGVAKLTEIIMMLKDKRNHAVKSRALITMYDARTRYSRVVLEKVQSKFGDNVFETVIRYNIRLRETVDYGLPVGDYDKHAIGHIDYENLADEVISEAATNAWQPDVRETAGQMLQETEDLMETTANQDPEEFGLHTDQNAMYAEAGSNFSEITEDNAAPAPNNMFRYPEEDI